MFLNQCNACLTHLFVAIVLTLSELRTPLNAAHSGMQLLQADLTMSTRPEDIDRLDTLNDVALSITTTVDILNDLLSFEKLESGLMTLHKSDVHVQV